MCCVRLAYLLCFGLFFFSHRLHPNHNFPSLRLLTVLPPTTPLCQIASSSVPFLPLRMAEIKITSGSSHWQGCGARGALFSCWWECQLPHPLWKLDAALRQHFITQLKSVLNSICTPVRYGTSGPDTTLQAFLVWG